MALKDLILPELISLAGQAVSGEELAKKYNVSRAAVWKAVRSLQDDGYPVASSIKGYSLTLEKDVLDSDLIRISAKDCRSPVYVFDTIDSTNNYAKILAAKGTPHGTLVCANHQTAGRGRQGHSFWSPKDLGLYFSLIIHPESTEHISRITPAAAVASVQAIEETAGIRPGIKWVNDLYVKRKRSPAFFRKPSLILKPERSTRSSSASASTAIRSASPMSLTPSPVHLKKRRFQEVFWPESCGII